MRAFLKRVREKLLWEELAYLYFLFTLLVGFVAIVEVARSEATAYQIFGEYVAERLWPFLSGGFRFAADHVLAAHRFLRELSDTESRESTILLYMALFGGVLMALFSRVAFVAFREQRRRVHAGGAHEGRPAAGGLKASAANVIASFRELPIARKTAAGVGGLVLTSGVLMLAVATIASQLALERRLPAGAALAATDLARLAEGAAANGDLEALNRLLQEQFARDGVAYALIEDVRGNALASARGISSGEGEESQPGPPRDGPGVHEASGAIGSLGYARIGLLSGPPERAARAVVSSLTIWVTVFLIAGGLAWILLVYRIFRPLHELAQAAERVSLGDFSAAATVMSNDEIADLARALERLRASLKAATSRFGNEAADGGAAGREEGF